MKPRTQLLTVIGLVFFVLGIAFFTFSKRNQEVLPVYPATIGRDCAPWDGAAFTLSVHFDPAYTIIISIWKSPDIKFPSSFKLSDETDGVGQAYILSEFDPLIPLHGKVSFQQVEPGGSVEGVFYLTDESGKRIKGKFNATWKNEPVMCG